MENNFMWLPVEHWGKCPHFDFSCQYPCQIKLNCRKISSFHCKRTALNQIKKHFSIFFVANWSVKSCHFEVINPWRHQLNTQQFRESKEEGHGEKFQINCVLNQKAKIFWSAVALLWKRWWKISHSALLHSTPEQVEQIEWYFVKQSSK